MEIEGTMTPSDIIEKARQAGLTLTLDALGTGLELSANTEPPDSVVELVKAHKPDIVAHLQAERRRINFWVANQIISWPPDSCLHCRKRIIEHPWVELAAGNDVARFHQACHSAWLAAQEAAARRALGIP
jgi:hypothetical protein